MFKHYLTVFLGASVIATSALAHEYQLKELHIDHPFARATVAQQTAGGAFLTIANEGKLDDRLISASSSIANSVELHSMEMAGDIMKMRAVDGIVLKAGSKLAMQPGGGYHVMLIGLTQQLKPGEHFPMTLQFEKAGKIEVMVHVEAEVTSHSH